jgi:protein-S-isoprenylcysteine O-methyltransferase Ste14
MSEKGLLLHDRAYGGPVVSHPVSLAAQEADMTRQTKSLFVLVGVVMSCAIVSLGLETICTNGLGWVIVFIGVAYCMGGAAYLAARVGVAQRVEVIDRSLWFIGPGFIAVFLASPLEYLYLPALLPRTVVMQVAGLGLVGLGLLLRFWAGWALRRRDSAQLHIRADRAPVRDGPYCLMRHPGYAGLGLLALGVCVGYSSLIGILAIPALLVPGVVYRIKVEDR